MSMTHNTKNNPLINLFLIRYITKSVTEIQQHIKRIARNPNNLLEEISHKSPAAIAYAAAAFSLSNKDKHTAKGTNKTGLIPNI